jgi:polyphosphate kinase
MLAQPMLSTTQTASVSVDLDAPSLYLNRESSWLQFNWRVLEEALDERHPLLERGKFLAIVAKNLDEFFMIRVSALLRQVTGGVLEVPPNGLRPSEQLTAIRLSNLSLSLAVVVNDPLREECFAWVKVEDMFPRLVRIPDED